MAFTAFSRQATEYIAELRDAGILVIDSTRHMPLQGGFVLGNTIAVGTEEALQYMNAETLVRELARKAMFAHQPYIT